MTCGLVIPRLVENEDDKFSVSVPVVKGPDGAPQWSQWIQQPDTHLLNIEEYLVAARLVFEN